MKAVFVFLALGLVVALVGRLFDWAGAYQVTLGAIGVILFGAFIAGLRNSK